MENTDRETLFRRQALAELARGRAGRPLANAPRPWRWLTGLSITCAVVAALFVTVAEYARKETVRGWLVAEQGAVRITHGGAATVDRVAVQAGAMVQPGDAILYLTGQVHLESGVGSAEAAISQLAEEGRAIESRKELTRKASRVEAVAVATQLDGIAAELDSLAERLHEQSLRVGAAREMLERTAAATSKGALTEWDVMVQRDIVSSQQQALDQLRQDRNRLLRERAGLESKRVALAITLEQALTRLDSERRRVLRETATHDMQRMQVLQSPITGKVASVEVRPGSAVKPFELLATILPAEYSMVAEVYVPSKAIGMVRRGQPVKLMYDAFPHRQFGMATGRVASVADYVLLPDDLPPTFGIREATYKVRVTLDAAAVLDGGLSYELRPGMLLAAEIILERRTLFEWLVSPLHHRALS